MTALWERSKHSKWSVERLGYERSTLTKKGLTFGNGLKSGEGGVAYKADLSPDVQKGTYWYKMT